MWLGVILAVLFMNVILFISHKAGPKAMILAWIPGRVIVLVFRQMHKTEFLDWLKITWASSIISVSFLAIFHFALRYISHKGRIPRFSCAHKEWFFAWILALTAAAMAASACLYATNDYILFALGVMAVYMNVVNVMDAPIHLQRKEIKLGIKYIIAVNIAIIIVLVLIDQLIENGYTKWAGLSGSIPLLAAGILAGSSCAETETAIADTSQHIYLLAYQTWPGMAATGILWWANPLGAVPATVMAGIACATVIGIQYAMIKTKL